MAYDVLTATVTGTMVGNEFAIATFIHPQIKKLSNNTHAQIATPVASVLGKVMPFWYALTLVLILGAALEHRPLTTGPSLFILLAAAILTLTIIFTIAMLVPLNNRIAGMDPDHPYECWLQDRCRWDKLHQVRVILLVMTLLLLLTGLLAGAGAPTI